MKKVGIIMGSKSDLPIMQKAIDILNQFGIDTGIHFRNNIFHFPQRDSPTIIPYL